MVSLKSRLMTRESFIIGELLMLSLLNITVHYCFAYTVLSCRNLIKPIAVQSKEKEDRYVDNYRVRPCRTFLALVY